MTTDKKTDARKLDHATLEVMRLRAIEATKAGMKATDLPGTRLRRASPHGFPLASRLLRKRPRKSS